MGKNQDPGSGINIPDPGSGINIPDPQHCTGVHCTYRVHHDIRYGTYIITYMCGEIKAKSYNSYLCILTRTRS
jgi:hypothetical protein